MRPIEVGKRFGAGELRLLRFRLSLKLQRRLTSMCQSQHPHKNEISFLPHGWNNRIIAVSKNDSPLERLSQRDNGSTSPIVIKGRASMPKRPKPPRLPVR